MQSLLDVQKAFYAPKEGPPMLLYHEPNPLRRRKRKRRKLSKKHVPIPHRPKDLLPSNFSASQLPEGFPPELAFRALAAYSLLRTLSCELRLSPFTPNVFLRALYLPFPSKLIGQCHASLLRILLASLNMGYSCKPKGNNIPDVVVKKRRVDGIRWPLRGGDNLTFLDNFSWPLFYDDYVHLTADILWHTLNSEENYADFRPIAVGMPDLTGMILEEDLREQEEERSLMAKPARISNTLAVPDKNPYVLEPLSRSSRSARRAKVSYAINVESDDDTYDEEEEEPNIEEDEEDYTESRKGSSKKRGRPSKRALPRSTAAKLPTQQHMSSPYSPASMLSRGPNANKGANGSNQRQKQSLKMTTKSKNTLPTSAAASKAKKNNRMLPSSRAKNKPVPSPDQASTKKRGPGAGRKLPTQGSKSSSPPTKKAKRSPFSGSKVEWVEEGPSPSHFGVIANSKSKSTKSFETPKAAPLPKSNPPKVATPATPSAPAATPVTAAPPASAATIPVGGRSLEITTQVSPMVGMPVAGVAGGMTVSPFLGQQFMHHNPHVNAALFMARAQFAQQMQLQMQSNSVGVFYPSGPAPVYNQLSTPMHHPSINSQHSGVSGISLPTSAARADPARGLKVTKEVASVLSDFIGGRLVNSSTVQINVKPEKELDNGKTSAVGANYAPKKEEKGRTNVTAISAKASATELVKAEKQVEGQQKIEVKRLSGDDVDKGEQKGTYKAEPSASSAQKDDEAILVTTETMDVEPKHERSSSSSAEAMGIVQKDKGMSSMDAMSAGLMDIDKHTWNSESCESSTTTTAISIKSLTATNDAVETGSSQELVNLAKPTTGADTQTSVSLKFGINAPENISLKSDIHADTDIHETSNGGQRMDLPTSTIMDGTAVRPSDASSGAFAVGSEDFVQAGAVSSAPMTCSLTSANEQVATEVCVAPPSNECTQAAAASEGEGATATPSVSQSATSALGHTAQLVKNVTQPPHDAPMSLKKPQKDGIQVMSTSFIQKGQEDRKNESIGNQDPLMQGKFIMATKDELPLEETPSAVGTGPVVESQVKKDNQDDGQSVTSMESESDTSVPFADDEEQWPQFQPIRSMRTGLPYHRLSLEEKLTVLEFLIDELLSMGTFASAFTQRNLQNSDGSSFGALPSEREFDELENEDECAVCKGEGELLCCDGCVSSYHRSCIDMKPSEVLPEGRWLCPECELIDPAKYGSLRGGRKSSLDWFTVDDIHTAIRLKHANEQNGLATQVTDDDGTKKGKATTNPTMLTNPSVCQPQTTTATASVNDGAINALVSLNGLNGLNPGQPVESTVTCASMKATSSAINSSSLPAEISESISENVLTEISGSGPPVAQEYLVVHGFLFARTRRSDHENKPSNTNVAVALSSLEPLSKTQLRQFLQSIGVETSLAWPLAQIPFTKLEESEVAVSRGIVHPKVLAFETKSTYDPSAYASKYRKTPLAKSAFPGANFHSIQLLLSDYEYVCNTCNLKRLSDRLSPDMSTDRQLAQSLRADANLFDPYQLIRDYMLKLENQLNRAHLLNEFWGTRNKDVKAHVWQSNVRNCRSIPRLAQLLLMLIDACHRRAFIDQWFVISGSKQEDHPMEETPRMESRALHPLPSDWTLEAEKRKRKWEKSSLANILSILAKEGRDVEQWVYGEGKAAMNRKKRKQVVAGRSPYSPTRTHVSSKDSKKFVVDGEMAINKAALTKRDIAGLVDKEKKRPPEHDAPGVLSIQVLQEAIDRRVTTGIPNEREKTEEAASQAETGGKTSAGSSSSRRSRRSGRLQTKKESPEDFIANVIAESGKAQKDLLMATLIEAQEMSKLVEIKDLSAVPFGGTGHWPVAGRLLFDPVGSLCRSEMRRLGRNAGTVMAQHVSYTGSYEVGQVSHFHVWRKNMQKCYSYEQLLLLIRALESNLDKPTIASCEALARRSANARSQVSKAIQCTLKDSVSGVDHHFIVQKSKSRGCWVSSLTLELSPFMVERSERREKQQDAFNKKLREKSMEEARAREAARLKAAAEAAARHQALMREQAEARAKAAREQAEAKAKALREKAEAKAAAKAAKAAQKAKEKAEKAAAKAKQKAEKDAAREAAKQAARAKALQQSTSMAQRQSTSMAQQQSTSMAQQQSTSVVQQAKNVVGTQNDVQRVLMAHKMATQKLIRESSNAGLSFVPEGEIKKLRMKAASDLQSCFGGGRMNSDALFSQLGNAESEALKAETEAKKAAVDKRLQNMAGGSQTTIKEVRQGYQTVPGNGQAQCPTASSSMYPPPASATSAQQNPALAKAAGAISSMHGAALGQEQHAGNRIRSQLQRTDQSSNLVSPLQQLSKAGPQSGSSYGATQSSQYPQHGNAYNPNPTGFFSSQNTRNVPSQSSSTARPNANNAASIGGFNHGAPSSKRQNPNNSNRGVGGMDWGGSSQGVPNHLLHALGGDVAKQHASLQGMNHQLRGNGNAWNIPRSSQEARGRDSSRERQMAELARLANGGTNVNVQHFMHGRPGGGMSSHHQGATTRGPASTSQYQELIRGTDYRATNNRLQTSSERLQNAMNTFPGGQLYQSAAAQSSRPGIPGYNNPNLYGGRAPTFQEYPGRDERRANSHPQQAFDFEPTPIAEMAPGPANGTPSNNPYNPPGYPPQHQHQHHHHQWFQR